MRKQAAKRKVTGDRRFNHVYASRAPRSYSVAADVHKGIKALAKKQNVSASLLVETALKEYLERETVESDT